jgi:6-phosphogluconolactonase (cycloisomerase 2 family)
MTHYFRMIRRIALAVVGSAALVATAQAGSYVGAVYVGTNDAQGNGLVAYGRNSNGTLTLISKYLSGGSGERLNGGGPVDPLSSAGSVLNVDDRYVLQVNAGSNTVSSFRVNPDYSLTLVSVVPSGGFGPDSIAEQDGIVYVTNVDRDGVFTGPADQVGNVVGFRLDRATGALTAIPGSARDLLGRPAGVAIAPDGRSLVLSLYNAGSPAIPREAAKAELESFAIVRPGVLTSDPVSEVTSTQLNNPAGRNLPGAIAVAIRQVHGHQVAVVAEAREFLADGTAASLSQFQTGSVSTFELNALGSLSPISLDVPTSTPITTGPTNTTTSSCWITFASDGRTFRVASASSSIISSFRFNDDGTVTLVDSREAEGSPANPANANPVQGASGFVDVAESSDNLFLYELLSGQGAVNVYRVGVPSSPLTLLQQVSGDLPPAGVQGLIYLRRHDGE